jgi:hypothetical protein
MLRLKLIFILLLFAVLGSITAQDGLNLPTELYTLLNEGRVERYGLGAAGVSAVTPEDQVVIDFGVAPDGVWMAYRTESGMTLRNMRTEESRELEGAAAGLPPFRGRGQTIAWSPDGEAIAYTTEYGVRFSFEGGTFFDIQITPLLHLTWSPDSRFLAAEAENNIWWIYRREGDQMILTSAIPSSIGLEWVGNGLLMFAPQEGGLFLMDVSNGNAQSVLNDTSILFRLPVLRQDSSVLIYGKSASDTTLPENVGYLYRVAAAGDTIAVEQVSEVPIDLTGLRWSPGGNLLLALQGGVLALVDPASGQGFTLPVTGVTTFGWGALRPVSAPSLTLTSPGYFIADDGTGVLQLWRLANDGARSAPLLSLTQNVETFAVAPDGQTLVYYSNGQLWRLERDAENAEAIGEVSAANNLSISPDGSTIAYDSDNTISTIPIEGGETQSLLTGYSEPVYSPDGSRLLVRIGDGDMGVLTIASGEVRRLGAFTWSKWLNDGRVVSYGAPTGGGQLGIYISDLNTEAPPLILYGQPPQTQSLDAALLQNGALRILQTRSVDSPAPLEVIDVPTTGEPPLPSINVGFIAQPSLSPDGWLIAGYANAVGSLVLYGVDLRQEVLLTNPPGILQFRWG